MCWVCTAGFYPLCAVCVQKAMSPLSALCLQQAMSPLCAVCVQQAMIISVLCADRRLRSTLCFVCRAGYVSLMCCVCTAGY